ncbi:MAG TPA: hypothetical protein VFU35_15485 [Jatrophihabitans sp.]|nr:hypothetical protein [Jatrophihabitans sp.]
MGIDSRNVIVSGADRDTVADVTFRDAEVAVHFHVGSGHVPPDARASVVDAVFELPELGEHRMLRASIPIGDAELLHLLRRRCPSLSARAAAATCLVDAELDAAI